MTKLKLGILTAIIIAGSAAAWAIQQSARTKLRERNESLEPQARQLALLSAENERLSNLLAVEKTSRSLSKDQLQELLKLRGQAGQQHLLRTEEDELRATNQRWRAALANSGTNHGYWTGDQLTHVGYAEPEAAMKSTLAVWLNGDPAAYLASCPPEERAAIEKEWQGKSGAEFAARCKLMAGLYAPATEGVRVLSKKTISQDEAVLDLYFEGDGKSREFNLKKFGDEWRVVGLAFIFD